MGTPTRFSTEYPERARRLLDELEPFARKHRLVGSYAVLAASSLLTVPFERADAKHFLHRDRDSDLAQAIEALKDVPFVEAPFWGGAGPLGCPPS